MRRNSLFPISLALVLALLLAPLSVYAAPPTATSFSTAVPVNAQSVIQLQGSDPDGTPLTFATTSSPSHGALSNLNASTGAVIYTPAAGYTGSDSFNYTVTSGGDTSSAGTVTITVTAAKTHVIETLTNPDGTPRQGKATFILTKVSSSPSGLIPAGASVTCQITSAGQCDVSLYPSRAVSPVQFYQVWHNDSNGNSQLLGIYDIPASTTAISLTGRRITDTNLQNQFVFATKAEVDALTLAVANATTAVLLGGSPTNNALQKYNSSAGKFADSGITDDGTTITASRNTSVSGNLGVSGNQTVGGSQTVTGTVTAAGYSGIQAANVPNLDASKITAGTLDTARLPSIPNSKTTATNSNTPVSIVARDANGDFAARIITASLTGNVTGNLTGNITGSASVGGNLNVTGTITGNGAGITGLTGATGGVANTGSTTVGADTDANGSGVIDEQIGGVTKRRLNNDGTTDLIGGLASYTKAGLPAAGNAGRLVRVTDDVRGFWYDTGTAWISMTSEVVNPRDFGVKCDGSTSDTSAFVSMLTALGGRGGATIQFPSATCRFATQVQWPSTASKIKIVGAGMGQTIFLFDVGGSPSSTQGMLIDAPTSAGINNLTFRDLTFSSTGDGSTSTLHLLEMDRWVYDVLFDHVEFKLARGAGARMAPAAGQGGARITFSNCYFHDLIDSNSPETTGGGLLFGNYSDVTVDHCLFVNVGHSIPTHAVYGTGNNPYFTFTNNTLRGGNGNTRLQTYSDPHPFAKIIGNTFEGVQNQFLYQMDRGVIANNTIYDGGMQVAGATSTTGALITGNTFTSSRVTDFITVSSGVFTISNNEVISTDPNAATVASNFISSTSPSALATVLNNRTRNVTQFMLLGDTVTADGWLVKGNTIVSPYAGGQAINVAGGANHVFENNTISLANGEIGIYFRNSASNGHQARFNVCSGGSFTCIAADSAGKVRLRGNDKGTGNYTGVSPTVAAGAGAGTSPTVAFSGATTDEEMTLTVTTGTSPSASATVVTITFNTAQPATPRIYLTPSNPAAAALSGNGSVGVGTISTTSFTLDVGSSALAASTTYKWTVLVK